MWYLSNMPPSAKFRVPQFAWFGMWDASAIDTHLYCQLAFSAADPVTRGIAKHWISNHNETGSTGPRVPVSGHDPMLLHVLCFNHCRHPKSCTKTHCDSERFHPFAGQTRLRPMFWGNRWTPFLDRSKTYKNIMRWRGADLCKWLGRFGPGWHAGHWFGAPSGNRKWLAGKSPQMEDERGF